VSRDLRRYASQTTFRAAVGAVLLLFIVGLGLVWLVYGPAAALTGLLCLLGALIPIGLIVLVIWGLDWALRRSNDEDS
jgi:predicted PurR-regulated permease PerM